MIRLDRPPERVKIQAPLLLAGVLMLASCSGTASVAPLPAATGQAHSDPAPLVVVIVVDQLRADKPWSLGDRSVGFARLWQDGIVYQDARFEHAFTLTGPGHATIFTGTDPSQHGIVANAWYSRTEHRVVESVSDADHPTFKADAGLSPARLQTSTLGDQLVVASGGLSKVLGVSGKSRAAILPAGKLGKAFWYEPRAGGFTTSTWYYETLPSWVESWNTRAMASMPTTWERRSPAEEQDASRNTDEFERPPAGMGRQFPHPLGAAGSTEFFTNLRFTPLLDELTLKFAETLIEVEELGADSNPDLLAVSLSSNDAIGHAFGPDSGEAGENLRRLDRALAEFFTFLDETVGPRNYLLVLTADHGVDAVPEAKAGFGLPAHRVDFRTVVRDANRRLREHYDVGADLIEAFASPFVYLDLDALEANGLDRDDVALTLAGIVEAVPGIARAIPAGSGAFEHPDPLLSMVRRSVYPGRSGDLYVVQEPSTFMLDDGGTYAATHGSPYAYDKHVPLMIYGAGAPALSVGRRVAPTAIASTLAVYLHVPLPPHARGEVLGELLGGAH